MSGTIAIAYERQPELRAVSAVCTESRLTLLQSGVLTLLSEGKTANQVGRRLDIERAEVLKTSQEVTGIFRARNLASAVCKAICEDELEIEIEPNEETAAQLTNDDRIILGYFACGGTGTRIIEATGVSSGEYTNYQKNLLKKVGAWTVPHAVRRSYELAIF